MAAPESTSVTLRLGQLRNVCRRVHVPEAATSWSEQMHGAGRLVLAERATRSTVAVPDMRTSLVSGGEMNTRLLACEPVGLFSRLASAGPCCAT